MAIREARQMNASPKALLDNYDLFPKKSLGQHFMHDPQLLDKIVDSAGIQPGETVIEVGAGTGSLTEKLAERGARVFAAWKSTAVCSPCLKSALTMPPMSTWFSTMS